MSYMQLAIFTHCSLKFTYEMSGEFLSDDNELLLPLKIPI